MPPDQKRDYAVGYGKPPRRSRFPKGQSGNPPGRSPGAKNLKALLSDALNEFVIVTENGGHRKITTREAIITQLVNRSVSRFSRDQDPPRHGAGYRRPDRAGICRDRLLQRGGREGHRAAQGALLESGKAMIENLTREQYDTMLRQDFVTFTARCFHDLKGKPLLATLLPRVARWGPGLPAGHRRPAKPI
jgi:hypothetical protein